MVMIDPERIQRLAEKMGNRNDALELVRQMRCGGKKFDGGGEKKPYNGEIRQGKKWNALDHYFADHPMLGHRLRKVMTLLYDVARVHPYTSFATDVYDSYVGPQDESDKITTPLGVVGRGADIILNTVGQAGEIEPNMKKVFGRSFLGRIISAPDFIDDSLKFIRDFSEPVTKYDGGGKFFRTNLQNESPLVYEPMVDINYPVVSPLRFRPQPDLGDYVAPSSTGMADNYPIQVPVSSPMVFDGPMPASLPVDAPVADLFSDEMVARRALKQRYAESAFNDKAKSGAGAQGAWQIMPITLKDYLGRGRGKAGDLNDPEYNRKVRDWVMGIIPRDLQEFWSDSDSDRAKLAKLYAAYNWGAGNLRSFLRKKQKAGVDISNPDNWVDDLNPETRRYVKYLAFDEDIPDSTVYTNAAFEKAAADRGFAEGGSIHIAPSKRGTFTAAAKKHGKSVQAFASQVLADKENYSPAMVKKANFARNAAKWHAEGGLLQRYSPEQIRDAISKIRK